MRTTIPARNSMLTSHAAYLDGGSGQATIQFFTGARPASVGSVPAGTLLGTLTMSRPGWATPSAGSMSANSIVGDSNADATGTIGCAVIRDSSGVITHDLSVSVTGGGGEIELDTLSVVAADTINITSLNMPLPIGV